jgi:D-aspartate ligase
VSRLGNSQITRYLRGPEVPVVVAGIFLPGVALLRNFERRGILVFGIDDDPNVIGFVSKFGRKRLCPNPVSRPEDWVGFMIDLADEIGERAVLITTADKFAVCMDDYAKALGPYYHFPRSQRGLVRELTSKRGLARLATAAEFAIPRTCLGEDRAEVEAFAFSAKYPCLIKPEFATTWREGVLWEKFKGKKLLVANSPENLLSAYDHLSEYGSDVILQEVIEGGDDNLFYVVCYMNDSGKSSGGFCGCKKRVLPIHYGSATYVEVVNNPKLENQCESFLEKVGYHGFAGIEVKFDQRDRQFKLIEVNPRYGLWDDLGIYVGVDVALIGYKDLLGERKSKVVAKGGSWRWVSFHRDIRAFFEYRKEGLVTFITWLRSLRKPIVWADPRWDDWKMSLVLLIDVILGAYRRCLRMFWGMKDV